MYGARDAAQNWQDTVVGHLVEIGFRRGISNPCTFWHDRKGVVNFGTWGRLRADRDCKGTGVVEREVVRKVPIEIHHNWPQPRA